MTNVETSFIDLIRMYSDQTSKSLTNLFRLLPEGRGLFLECWTVEVLGEHWLELNLSPPTLAGVDPPWLLACTIFVNLFNVIKSLGLIKI